MGQKPVVVLVRMGHEDAQEGVGRLTESRHSREQFWKILIGLQGQAQVQQQALALRLHFDAASPDLVGAAVDADSHWEFPLKSVRG
jgi:hypothetical protein